MDEVVLVYSTAPDIEIARQIARVLVDEKLAACVSLLPSMQSVYRWQGKVEEAQETYIMIKTKRSCFSLLSERLQTLHPYELPEIVCISVKDGLPGYLQWIGEETI